MAGHGAKIGRKGEAAIAALLTHRSVDEAAAAVKISGKTLLRWLKQPAFHAAYRAARRSAFEQSIARLQQAATAAVSTVLKIMVDPGAPASTRLKAADIILDRCDRAFELDDIEGRVMELERAARRESHGSALAVTRS